MLSPPPVKYGIEKSQHSESIHVVPGQRGLPILSSTSRTSDQMKEKETWRIIHDNEFYGSNMFYLHHYNDSSNGEWKFQQGIWLTKMFVTGAAFSRTLHWRLVVVLYCKVLFQGNWIFHNLSFEMFMLYFSYVTKCKGYSVII